MRVRLDDIELHPRNPRRGKPSLIKESIKKNGYYPSIMIQLSRKRAIKGNNTVKALRELNAEEKYTGAFDEIEVEAADISDAHALRIVLMDNRSSDDSTYDNKDLFAALKEVDKNDDSFFGTGYTQDDFDYLARATGESSILNEDDLGEESDETEDTEITRIQTRQDVPDTHFLPFGVDIIVKPSIGDEFNLQLNMPKLSLKQQADAFDMPIVAWGSQRGRKCAKRQDAGTFHMYTGDAFFERFWREPQLMVNARPINVIEANFSITPETSIEQAFWQTYRKRWLSRYWQSKGLRIIVDLTVNKQAALINMLGVPQGWQSYATRGYIENLEDKEYGIEFDYKLACERAGTDDILFLVYGGSERVKEYCNSRGWFWQPEELALMRGKHVHEAANPKGKKKLVKKAEVDDDDS